MSSLLSPLSKIIFIRRILLFASTEPKHAIELASITSHFRETIIDFKTALLIWKQLRIASIRDRDPKTILFPLPHLLLKICQSWGKELLWVVQLMLEFRYTQELFKVETLGNWWWSQRFTNGRSPLYEAIQNQQTEVVSAILDYCFEKLRLRKKTSSVATTTANKDVQQRDNLHQLSRQDFLDYHFACELRNQAIGRKSRHCDELFQFKRCHMMFLRSDDCHAMLKFYMQKLGEWKKQSNHPNNNDNNSKINNLPLFFLSAHPSQKSNHTILNHSLQGTLNDSEKGATKTKFIIDSIEKYGGRAAIRKHFLEMRDEHLGATGIFDTVRPGVKHTHKMKLLMEIADKHGFFDELLYSRTYAHHRSILDTAAMICNAESVQCILQSAHDRGRKDVVKELLLSSSPSKVVPVVVSSAVAATKRLACPLSYALERVGRADTFQIIKTLIAFCETVDVFSEMKMKAIYSNEFQYSFEKYPDVQHLLFEMSEKECWESCVEWYRRERQLEK